MQADSTAATSPSTRSGPAPPPGPAIISYRLLGADAGSIPTILEQTVRINGEDYAIIGVAPKGFSGTTAIIGTEFFVPLGVHDAIESDFDSRDQLAALRPPQPFADRRRTAAGRASRARRPTSS